MTTSKQYVVTVLVTINKTNKLGASVGPFSTAQEADAYFASSDCDQLTNVISNQILEGLGLTEGERESSVYITEIIPKDTKFLNL